MDDWKDLRPFGILKEISRTCDTLSSFDPFDTSTLLDCF